MGGGNSHSRRKSQREAERLLAEESNVTPNHWGATSARSTGDFPALPIATAAKSKFWRFGFAGLCFLFGAGCFAYQQYQAAVGQSQS
jgi:hypothetical protein